VAATISAARDPEIAPKSVPFVTRRELAVLAMVVAVVVGALLLLVLTSSQVANALLDPP